MKKEVLKNDKKNNENWLENFLVSYNKNEKKDFENIVTPLTKGPQTLIKVTSLVQIFGKGPNAKKALDGVCLEIRDGENLAIVGPNGSGKTTTVESIAGLNKPTSGNIEYLFKWNKSPMENIGIQFQKSSYPNGLSVKKIINFYISVFDCRLTKKEIESLIKIFGIDEFYKKNAQGLSGGQMQRINALLAIMHKPKVVFMDEISAGLDINIKFRIKKFMKEFAKENGMTIVTVSHEIDEVEYIADRIIVLIDGKVAASIYKEEAIKKYGSLEKFFSKYI
ncbi:MAG: ABC transporter ATP-binding protein [Mycoplasmoidaceae bacterium]